MNTQINVRFPTNLLSKAKRHAKKEGYANIQELIREALRREINDGFGPKEIALLEEISDLTKKHKLYADEKEVWKALRD